MGSCERVKEGLRVDEPLPAYIFGSGWLMTAPDFGCVQWEAKVDAD
jgi:hypothetical protein